MARAWGAEGVTITLLATGGLISSHRDQDRYVSEMFILAAGPAVSFAFGGALIPLLDHLTIHHRG